MNYLVHLYLSEPTAGCRLGNLMGDFVKGPLGDAYPAEITRGLEQHRKLDSFAHTCSPFRRSKARIDDSFGHYKGILVDVFYDHVLARNWSRYSPVPLESFAHTIYQLLESHFALLPAGLQRVAPRMIRQNWLVSYREPDIIALVLERIAKRLRRPNPLVGGLSQLQSDYDGFAEDCDAFLAAADHFMKSLHKSSSNGYAQ